jgi:hypothetical protein
MTARARQRPGLGARGAASTTATAIGQQPTAQVTVPLDPRAEDDLAGCAAATCRGARLALGRVHPADLYDPRAAQVLARALSAAVVAAELAAPPGDAQDARLAALAAAAGVDPSWLKRVVDERAVMFDTAGAIARRVKDAAVRRRLMAAAAKLHNAASTAAADDLATLAEHITALAGELVAFAKGGLRHVA